MEAILKFDLEEDKKQFNVYSRAMDWALVVWEMDQYLRSILKYKENTDEVSNEVESIRTKLFDIMDEFGVSFVDIE